MINVITMKDAVMVGVVITTEQKRQFHTRCVEYGTTMSNELRTAIEDWMTKHPVKTVRHATTGVFD
jgi:hypothetical protein